MYGRMIRGWDLIVPGWRWLMLSLLAGIIPLWYLLEQASTLWHGFGQWVEMESANRMRDC